MNKIKVWLWKPVERLSLWCIHLLFRMMHKELTKEGAESFLQLVRFGMVGVSNTIVNYVVYVGVMLFLHLAGLWDKYDYLIATVLGFVISVLWAFFWNNKYVFKEKEGEHRSVFKTLVKTFITYSFTGLFLNSFLMVLWVDVFHMSKFIAPIINMTLGVPINFLINKFWAYK